MELIEVRYPFVVDETTNSFVVVYESLGDARAGAQDLFSGVAAIADDEDDDRCFDAQADLSRPAVVMRQTVAKLTKSRLVGILNGEKLWWAASVTLGEFRWSRGQIRLVRSG